MKLVFVTLLAAAGIAFAAEPAKKEEKKVDVKLAPKKEPAKKEEAPKK